MNIATNNTRPEAILDYQDGFAIPISTPFYLEGGSIDMEGDNVTYCFEQHDFGSNSCGLGNPTGSCPMFRSFPPRTEDYRVFPDFNVVWNNQLGTSRNEVLVDYSREMNFVLTVRDNNPEVGAWGHGYNYIRYLCSCRAIFSRLSQQWRRTDCRRLH